MWASFDQAIGAKSPIWAMVLRVKLAKDAAGPRTRGQFYGRVNWRNRMLRYSLIFGAIIGCVILAFMAFVLFVLGAEDMFSSELAGYAVMLAVLSLVFVGIKRFRDVEQGGVISFTKAFSVGVGIATVAGVFYAVGWEFFLVASDFAFIEAYSQGLIAEVEAKDIDAAAKAAEIAEINSSVEMYRNPLFRLPITFIEIFPVGLVVALVSALILKNPKALPAKMAAKTAS